MLFPLFQSWLPGQGCQISPANTASMVANPFPLSKSCGFRYTNGYCRWYHFKTSIQFYGYRRWHHSKTSIQFYKTRLAIYFVQTSSFYTKSWQGQRLMEISMRSIASVDITIADNTQILRFQYICLKWLGTNPVLQVFRPNHQFLHCQKYSQEGRIGWGANAAQATKMNRFYKSRFGNTTLICHGYYGTSYFPCSTYNGQSKNEKKKIKKTTPW